MRAVALGLGLVACGGGTGRLDGTAHASRDRRVLVLERGRDLIVDGRRLPRGACVTERPDELLVSDDGARALAVAWRSRGGSIHDHVEHELRYACEIDLASGAQQAHAGGPGRAPVPRGPQAGWELRTGARTGWTYELAWSGAAGRDRVFDPAGGRGAPMPLDLQGDYCDLVETEAELVTACVRFEPTFVDGQRAGDRTWIEVARLGHDRFPPVVHARWELPVARASQVRLDREGRRAVWWASSFDGPSPGGLIDATTGAPGPALPGEGPVVDVDFGPGGDQLVVAERRATRREATRVRRLALAAGALTEQARWQVDDGAHRLFWMADGRIVLAGFGWTVALATVR